MLLFGKGIACIATHEGVAMELQILRPYGAGSAASNSLFVVREVIVMLSVSETSHFARKRKILRCAQDDKERCS